MKYALASVVRLVLLLLAAFLWSSPKSVENDQFFKAKADRLFQRLERDRLRERDIAVRDFAVRMQKINDDIDSSFTKEDNVKLTPVPDYVRRVLVLAR